MMLVKEIYLGDEAFNFGQIQPGLPKRGKFVFNVPIGLKGLIEISVGGLMIRSIFPEVKTNPYPKQT